MVESCSVFRIRPFPFIALDVSILIDFLRASTRHDLVKRKTDSSRDASALFVLHRGSSSSVPSLRGSKPSHWVVQFGAGTIFHSSAYVRRLASMQPYALSRLLGPRGAGTAARAQCLTHHHRRKSSTWFTQATFDDIRLLTNTDHEDTQEIVKLGNQPRVVTFTCFSTFESDAAAMVRTFSPHV